MKKDLIIAIIFALVGILGLIAYTAEQNIRILELNIANVAKQVKRLEQNIKVIQESDTKHTKVIQISVSAYNAIPNQTDSTPFIMASGKRVYEGAIALSRDIERDFGLKFGDKIHLLGIGTFVFLDRMHRRWKRRVDLFKWSKKKAIQFGRQKAIMVIRGG